MVWMFQPDTRDEAIRGEVSSLTGVAYEAACKGFPGILQCLTAAHLASNAGVDFACLKAALVPDTAVSGVACPAGLERKHLPFLYRTRLSEAVKAIEPDSDPDREIKPARNQVEDDAERAGYPSSHHQAHEFLEGQRIW